MLVGQRSHKLKVCLLYIHKPLHAQIQRVSPEGANSYSVIYLVDEGVDQNTI